MRLIDTDGNKILASPDYSYVFVKSDGLFLRWGKTEGDDPQWSPFGPEIADIEISKDGCPGFGKGVCAYCYKSNTGATPTNMSLDTFKVILDKLGKQLTQVAFGITGVKTNPDFIPMMEHCRDMGIIPNFTLSGADLDDEDAARIGKLAGAVAVSYHGDWDLCRKTVACLCMAGVKQVNIHAVTLNVEDLKELVVKVKRAEYAFVGFHLNALVLLSLKPKGRAHKMHNISEEELSEVVKTAQMLDVPLGFDSCSAHRALAIYPKEMHTFIEPCESGLFSSYIDCVGKFHACSFAEGENAFGDGIDVVNCEDFLKDVWMSPQVVAWREKLLAMERHCPLF